MQQRLLVQLLQLLLRARGGGVRGREVRVPEVGGGGGRRAVDERRAYRLCKEGDNEKKIKSVSVSPSALLSLK